MAAVNKCGLRLSDLRTMAWYTSGALNNKTGGQWEKYPFDGKGTNDTGFPIKKPSDFELKDLAAQQELFDRTVQGDLYKKTLTEAGPCGDIYVSKRQCDMLSSMLQGVGQRYSSRIRNMAAAMSRRTSIAQLDADTMMKDLSRLG